MDIYTTSFCLPHRTQSPSGFGAGGQQYPSHTPSTSSSTWDLAGDPEQGSTSSDTVPPSQRGQQQQQQQHFNVHQHYRHVSQQQQQPLDSQSHPPPSHRQLSSSSLTSTTSARPAAIPEAIEPSDVHNGGARMMRSSNGGSNGGSNAAAAAALVGNGQSSRQRSGTSSSHAAAGMPAVEFNNSAAGNPTDVISLPGGRRSSSFATGHHSAAAAATTSTALPIASTTASSSTTGDAFSTAPSSATPSQMSGVNSLSSSLGTTVTSSGGAVLPSAAGSHHDNAGPTQTSQNHRSSSLSHVNATPATTPHTAAPLRSSSTATLKSSGVGATTSPEMDELMHKLCIEAMTHFQCMVACSPLEDGTGYNFHLSGGYQQVMGARGYIFRASPFKKRSVVKVPRSEVLDAKEHVKTEMRRKLDEIAALTKAHLAIVGQVSGTIGHGLETERNVEIVVTGAYESVEQARVRLLVLLDELSGLHSDVCEIDYKLHNIIAGRKRQVIQTIQEETATNIYFPTPLSGVLGTRDPALLSKQNLIFITGEFFGVQRARDMLFQVSLHKSKCIISRDTALLPRKLDWLLSDHLEEIIQIMHDNGTFINFPLLGSQASLISVYGDHRVNIERTIRAIMGLACQFYVSQFWLLPMSFDVFLPPPSINPSQIPAVLKLLSAATGVEAVFKSNCFEFHGTEGEVRRAVQLALDLDIVKAFHHEIRFQIELANEHREFISGKKNGKLNKIMKAAGVKIKFETFNDYNFLIDTAGNDTGALHGLSLLQEELPAEISFHVPEIYHKRIIGVGGKNIQRIMKKFGVYVKFSNAEELASLGGYLDNEDNVVARTPAKNSQSLEQLKQAVMEMVIPKDKDFVVESVSIPRRYHRTLLGEKSIFIHDIENKTNSKVRFPNKETASDTVSIYGPESQVHIAAQMLLDHVPFEAEYRLPHSEEMSQLALSSDFLELQDRIKRDLNVTILPWVDRTGGGDETVIRFLLNRSNQHYLAPSRDAVEEFLLSHNIPLYPGSLRPRSDSFQAAFPFFNSKLLSNVIDNEPNANAPYDTSSSNDLKHQQAQNQNKSQLRPAASNPDIKAIFDASPVPSAYAYMPPRNEHTSPRQASFYSQQQLHSSTAKQGNSPVRPDFQPLHTPRFYPSQQGHGQHGSGHGGHSYSISSIDTFVPSPPHRLSGETDRSASNHKRESDPVMDDKVKELVRRGVIGHHLNARAQSLDISRQTEAFGLRRGGATASSPNETSDQAAVSAALSSLGL